MTEKGCDNCYYTYFDEKAYPCSLCIRGIERTDQWQPSKKTKAKGITYNPTSVNNIWEKPTNPYIPNEQTEPQGICNACYKNPCKKKKMINDIGNWVVECTEYKPKDEPQTDCPQSAICGKPCKECGACEKECGMWEILKTEPQTYVINPQEPTNDEKCFECDDFFTCDGQCDEVEDGTQTEKERASDEGM